MPVSYGYAQQQLTDVLAESLTIALYTKPPQGTSGGVECSSPGYSRQSISLAPVLNLAASNSNALNWSATGQWAPVYYFGICEAASGDLLYFGALSRPLTANTGQTVTIPAGALLIDWTNPSIGTFTNYSPNPTGPDSNALTPVTLQSEMIALTSLPITMISVTVGSTTYSLLPVDQAVMNVLTAVHEQRVGQYLRTLLYDCTRGTTAGYTVTGPLALAF